MTTSPSDDNADWVLEAEHPDAVIATTLLLSYLRAIAVIGPTLAQKFPTQADWDSFIRSKAFVETVDEVSQVLKDIRETVVLSGQQPEDFQKAAAQHMGRALDATKELSTLLGVPGDVLLSVLIHA